MSTSTAGRRRTARSQLTSSTSCAGASALPDTAAPPARQVARVHRLPGADHEESVTPSRSPGCLRQPLTGTNGDGGGAERRNTPGCWLTSPAAVVAGAELLPGLQAP